MIFKDIKNINWFRHDPHKARYNGEWKKQRFWKWKSTCQYIKNPSPALDLFKINIISDGSEHGYYLRLNNQVNNTHIFCGTKVFLKEFKA